MCSIIGYAGRSVAAPVLVSGLRRMEYRGYDSVGVATWGDDGSILLRKGAGRVEEVNGRLGLDGLAGHAGMGHTRWATHGTVKRCQRAPPYEQRRRGRHSPQRGHREPLGAAPVAGGLGVRVRQRDGQRGYSKPTAAVPRPDRRGALLAAGDRVGYSGTLCVHCDVRGRHDGMRPARRAADGGAGRRRALFGQRRARLHRIYRRRRIPGERHVLYGAGRRSGGDGLWGERGEAPRPPRSPGSSAIWTRGTTTTTPSRR